MKKIISILLCAIMMCGTLTAFADLNGYDGNWLFVTNTAGRINVRYQNETTANNPVDEVITRIAFDENARPFIDADNRTQVPVRKLSEALNFVVNWDNATQEVVISNNNTKITMYIGSNRIIVNGREITMDTAAQIVNDRTYIPLRYVGEALGYQIDYNEAKAAE